MSDRKEPRQRYLERRRYPERRKRLDDFLLRGVILPSEGSKTLWDTLQSGLSVKVRSTGTKTFRVHYRHAGQLRWFTIGRYPTIALSDARDIAKKIRARAALGEDPHGEKMREREEARIGDKLNDLHRNYVERYASKKNRRWRDADKLMKRYVLPKLGTKKARLIKREDVERIFDELTDRQRPALANQVVAAISATFSWAVKKGKISDNPCRGIERNKLNGSGRYLSNDEIRTVWPLFDDLGLLHSTVLKVILLTAQRPGEVSAMRWEHIDWSARLWTMPGEPADGWPGTKNKRDHEVPLTEPVLALLRELEPASSGFVFPSVKRGRHISIPATKPVWSAAGIERFRPHDLRATAATGMDQLEVARLHLSLVLNHVEGGITERYVRHEKRKQKQAALEAWAAELMAILKGKGKTDHEAEVVELEVAAEQSRKQPLGEPQARKRPSLADARKRARTKSAAT